MTRLWFLIAFIVYILIANVINSIFRDNDLFFFIMVAEAIPFAIAVYYRLLDAGIRKNYIYINVALVILHIPVTIWIPLAAGLIYKSENSEK